MARPKLDRYRDPTEHAGYMFEPTHLLCPKCNAPCRALFSPKAKKPRGIECTKCTWTAYPATLPTPTGQPTSETKKCPPSTTGNAATPPNESSQTCSND